MITDRRSLLASLAALTALPAIARAQTAPMTRDEGLAAAFAETAPVGLAGLVVGREGVIWCGATGVRRFGSTEAVTTDDRWHLGSNTKAMTAALYGRLVDQGRARRGAPVREIFSGLSIDPAWDTATIEDFMHHRAGLDEAAVMGMSWLMTARGDPRSLRQQRAAIVAAALAKPPTGVPGAFAYANANYVVVGAAIETLLDQAWEEAMRTEMFAPLGMASAGFGPPAGANAWGHRGAGAARMAMDPAHPGADNPLAMGPAGTAHMTLADYGRFLSLFLNDGGGYLKPETVAALKTPPASETPPPYAGGWIVLPSRTWAAGGPVLTHDGSNTMWHVTAAVAPAAGLALVAAANDGVAGGAACQSLLPKLITARV